MPPSFPAKASPAARSPAKAYRSDIPWPSSAAAKAEAPAQCGGCWTGLGGSVRSVRLPCSHDLCAACAPASTVCPAIVEHGWGGRDAVRCLEEHPPLAALPPRPQPQPLEAQPDVSPDDRWDWELELLQSVAQDACPEVGPGMECPFLGMFTSKGILMGSHMGLSHQQLLRMAEWDGAYRAKPLPRASVQGRLAEWKDAPKPFPKASVESELPPLGPAVASSYDEEDSDA